MRLTYKDIDHFLTLCRSETRIGAAASLGVSRAALGRVIQRVEMEFGLKLVVEGARGVQMTEGAERLIPSLQAMIASHLDAIRLLAELRKSEDKCAPVAYLGEGLTSV